jgi:glycosyltransferase involved in cell wall biosynthesis
MRDFWPDARKEVKSFDVENNFLHKKVYDFFKSKEKEFLGSADYIISLTEAGKKVLEQWKREGIKITAPIAVIPCCADFDFFDPTRIKPDKIQTLRHSLGISEGDFVLNYLGSLGPAYLTNEVLDFYKILLQVKPEAKFLVVANNDHHLIKEAAKEKRIDAAKLIVTKGAKDEIPYLIALSNLSVFFIMPSFAKQACSPTKLAELFAMNIPVISNTKVGDLDSILNLKENGSEVVQSFDNNEYQRVIRNILNNHLDDSSIRKNSISRFSVQCGIESYNEVYGTIF